MTIHKDHIYETLEHELECHFHMDQLVIGKTLILTQDDWRGACDSAHIYHIIETCILPHFKI